MTERRWKKSSRSNQGTNCVEVADDLAALRDSKNPSVELEFSRPVLELFMARVKSGSVK